MMSEPLTDEQIRKRAIGVEDVDPKGLVKRHRVLSQTIFDMLFLKELIDQSQYESAHLFMDAISRSGAAVRSANLDTEVFTPHRDVGNMIGERRMAFSSAYRKMVGDIGEETSREILRYFSDVYSFPEGHDEHVRIAAWISPALDSLASHYGVDSVRDPRRLIRVQVGAGPKKNEGKGP